MFPKATTTLFLVLSSVAFLRVSAKAFTTLGSGYPLAFILPNASAAFARTSLLASSKAETKVLTARRSLMSPRIEAALVLIFSEGVLPPLSGLLLIVFIKVSTATPPIVVNAVTAPAFKSSLSSKFISGSIASSAFIFPKAVIAAFCTFIRRAFNLSSSMYALAM